MESLDSRIAQVANGAVRRQLGREVHAAIQRGDYQSALRICDALILYPNNELSVLCNALWVVQPDNTGQPLDEGMAKRFLAASIFRAGFNPAMHINAAAVYAHFDDAGRVLRHLFLAKQHQQDLSLFLDDPLFDHVRTDPRWAELLGTHEPVDEPTWIEVALEACEAGEYTNAFPALWWFWSNTRSSRIAELIELVSERVGSRVGYQGEVLEAALRDAPETLATAFNNSVRRGTRSDASGIVPSVTAGEDLSQSLVWLADDAADPRFATAMLRILGSAQLPAKKTVQDGLRSLLDNLEALRDKRIASGLAELSKELLEAPTALESWLALELAHLSGVLAALPEPELTPTESRGCERLEALLGQRTGGIGYVRPKVRSPVAPKQEVDPLLALWRETRNVDVADVLDLQRIRHPETPDLGQSITGAFIPGEGSDRDVGAFAAAQLIWDAKHHDDPRLASTLIKLFDDPPFLLPLREGNGVEEFWREVISACDSLRDPRLVATLRAFSSRTLALCRAADAEARGDMYIAFPLGPFLKAQLEKCADRIEASSSSAALDEEQRKLLDAARVEYAAEKKAHDGAQLRGADRGVTEASLLAEISGEPDNDAARLAYADFLGDTPRARFIRLQVARAAGGDADREAEASLQAEHQFRWVEPFSHFLTNLVFERGFLASCSLRLDPYGDPLPDECVGHPLWATVHTVRSDTGSWRTYDQELLDTVPSNTIEAFAHAAMRSLVHLDGVSAEGLVELVARGRNEYEGITLEPHAVDEESWPKVVEALSSLPNLQTLRLRFSGRTGLQDLLPFLDAREGLQHLKLEIDAQGLQRARLSVPLCEELFESGFTNIAFVWSANNYDRGIERDELLFTTSETGWDVLATQQEGRETGGTDEPSHAPTQFWLSPFITQLKQLPMDALTSFRLGESGVAPSQASLDALSKALETFPRLETVELLPAGDSPEEIQRLIAALEDPERAEHSCRLLGSFKDPAAKDALARHAAHNEALSVRYAAIEALAELADESVVPTLCEALDTTEAGAKGVELLGYLRARDAIPALIDYAPRVEASYARSQIAEAFTRIDSPDAIPVLLESYAKEPSAETLIALSRLGAPEARALALAALESGGDGAFVALAFVGKPEDSKLLEGFFDSRLGVTHIRGLPLLAWLALVPDGSPAHIEKMAGAIEKSWSSGVSEDCAWLMLELRSRLGTPGPKWSNFAAQVLEWCESCIAWSHRVRAETSYGLDARKWMYWEDLLHEVVTAWRSPLPNHSARAGTL
ncbi:MAG: HEAT repeat domain-containing protein [Polyangiales bacterium]